MLESSFHNDAIRGDDNDNRIRGGRGADVIDGRGGFDIADYSQGDEAVAVNLALGVGTAGEAAGDTLANIEMLVGTIHADSFTGSAGADTFDGGFGNDTIAGGAGSDHYQFGFERGEDLVIELGDAADTDEIVMLSPVRPKDVSVLREGDDLFIELERDNGTLIDTLRVRDHFLGTASGIEAIVFGDGTRWDRDTIDTLQRIGRFNAADDIVRFAIEDQPIVIDPAALIANDAEDVSGLVFAGVEQPQFGSVHVRDDGLIEFLGAPNHNGDAFFHYLVRDQYGRESSARVEVNLAPVNDAPTAVDDDLVYGLEDEILRIRIDTLLANDWDVDGDDEGLHIVGLRPLENGSGGDINAYKHVDYFFSGTNVSGSVKGDYLEFKLKPDYFGPAGFQYVLADSSGATSTASVEIYISPVNDAPRAKDDLHHVRLGNTLTFSVADLLANSYDIEGDAVTFVGLHPGADDNPASSGSVAVDQATGNFVYTPSQLGLGFIEYDVIDARGAASTLRYQLKVRPLNDPPKAHNDYGLRTLEDQLLVIDPASLLANDTDENGDTLILESIATFAENGKVRRRADGLIEFAPRSDYNGSAGFSYTISDGRGGFSTAYVSITVMPRNAPAILRNDLVAGLEDGALFVIPAEAFGNDIEPDGDVLFFERAQILGVIDHRFLSPDFTVSARMADGSALPAWLSFDAATMTFAGTLPEGQIKASVDVWITDPVNGNVFNTRFTLNSADLASGESVRSTVMSGYRIREAHETRLEFTASALDGAETVVATLADGSALPTWLAFDPATLRFTGTAPEGTTAPVAVVLSFTRPGTDGPVSFTDTATLDPAALPAGVAYDSGVALFDLEGATVAAQVQGGRPLPEWLRFDAASRSLELSGFAPDEDAQPVRLQVVFTPPERTLPNGVRASSDRGFTLEFLIGPETSLAEINAVLAGEPYFAEQGLFALDLSGATVTAARESGAPLNSWLAFDAADLTFAGTPPPEWVGALPVRLDVASGSLPAMSIITEVVVDDTFRVDSLMGLGLTVRDERIDLKTPKDFNGTVVFSYDTTDEKGAVSQDPALIFFNVRPTRERPDAGIDAIAVDEGESVRFAVASLLANDFDRDGDAVRVASLGAPAHGTLVLELAQVAIDPPAALAPLEGAVWSAVLADGSVLPAWLTVDAATGALGGEVPLAFAGELAIRVTRTLDGVSDSATVSHTFDGNLGAFAVYTPDAAYSGEDSFAYSVTDGREGASAGKAVVTVNPVADPPVARGDSISALEDTPLTIDPAALLANDYDVDGDPIRFLGVSNASRGTVSYDGEQILFTPEANFSGPASFEYQVTDDRHGVSTGRVTVHVASTNRAPTPGADVFQAIEDTPFTFTIAELMANDSDPDGDALRFQSIKSSVEGGRILELPGGRYQFVPDENVNGPLGFSYVVSDGRRSTTASITFDIAAVNDAPIANDDGFFAGKVDQDLTIDFAELIANDRDVEGDSFTIVELFDGDQGIVTRVGDTAVFSPDGGYFGDAGFHYRVTDSHGASSVGYVNLTIYPEFPLPIASSDHGLEVLEDGFLDIDPALLMANDTAPEGSTLSFVDLLGAELQADGRYRFTPSADFFGEVTLRYAIENEQGFPVWSTVSISVLAVEDAPVAGDDFGLITAEDTPLTIFADRLTANDKDVDRQAIFISGIVEAHGVTVTDIGFGQLEITPDADFDGTAWFDYELSDSTGRTDVARVTVEVTPENDPPVITAVPVLRGLEDLPFSAALPAGLVTDADGDIVQVSLRGKDGAELPAWLHYDAQARALSGQPPADFHGTVALEVVASDGSASAVREVIVSIESVNDAPVVGSGVDDVAAVEDTAFAVALRTDAFADVDGDALALSVALADGSPPPAWLTLAGGVLSGTPPHDFNGELALTVTASDGQLAVSEPFVLRVAAVNDAPIVAQPLGDAIYDEDSSFVLALPEGSFADIDGDALTLTAALAGGETLPAWLAFDGERFTGTPPADFHGELDLRVTASDGTLTASDVFRLTIVPVNDAPAVLVPLADLQTAEDTAFSIALPTSGIADVDGDTLSFSVLLADGSALPGWLSFTGTHLEGTPPADFEGRLDLQLVASDGALSASDPFSLLVSAVNDAPVLLAPLSDLSSPEDAAFDFVIATDRFGDVDGDALTLTALLGDGNPLPAWLAFDGAHLTGTPPADFNGLLEIAITASDGALSVSGTFRLEISAVNDAPVLLAPLADYTVAEDAPISFTLPAGTFGDIDGDTLTLAAKLGDGSALPTWLTFDGASFSGQAPGDFNGSLAITVTASDGTLTASDGFVLTVAAVNDPPVLLAPFADLAFDEDTPFAVTLDVARFADVDGDPLALSLTLADGSALPEWLAFDGATLSGTPQADWNGSLALRIRASDGSLSASDEFTLTIAPVNDAPVTAHWFGGAVHSAEDAAIDLPLPAAAFTDIDGDPLTVTATLADGTALPGWLAFDGARFTGTPPADFNGALALLVTASDGVLGTTAALDLVIDPINDRPVLVTPLADRAVTEDMPFAVEIPLASFADVDGDPLAFSARLAGGGDLPGWLEFDGATLRGTPPQDFNGAIDIEVLASDGALVATDTFRLTVTPTNDLPVVVTPLPDLVTAEDHAISLALPTTGITDVDGDPLAFSVLQADGSALPTWLSFTGSRLEGTPPVNFNGQLALQLVASDGQGSVADPFTLTIVAINDAPVVLTPLANRNVAEDTAFAFAVPAGTFGDVEGDALTLSARLSNGNALPLWLNFDGATFAGTPPANFNGSLEIDVTANDGLLAATTRFVLAIDPVNDAPTASNGTGSVEAGQTASGQIAANDVDGDTLSYSLATAPGHGTVTLNAATGAYSYAASAGYAGADSFAVDVSDGKGGIARATIAYTVTGPTTTTPIYGSWGNDVLTGGAGNDQIYGGDGNDTLSGLGGNDALYGGTGTDSLAGGQGDDRLEGGDGNDTLFGEAGNDTLLGGTGADVLDAGDGDDVLQGGDGNDQLRAGAGADQVDGGTGHDLIYGGDGNDILLGKDGDDVILGEAGDDRLEGGTGHDSLNGGDGTDILIGSDGNDTLVGGIGDDSLDGGNGNDQFTGGAGNDTLTGGWGTDTANFAGVSTTYSVVTTGGTVRIVDNNATADGNDGTDTITGIERLVFKNNVTVNIVSPIILDLAGDGIETLSAAQSHALFDLDGDGLADDTSWIGKGDGFLYLDRDGNGTMSGADEITFIDDLPDATSDLAGLRAFDSNGDGKLTSADARFADFGVWRDADGDGAVDAGETTSLGQAGIASIGLAGTAKDGTTALGEAAVLHTGSFTTTGGQTRGFADAALTYYAAASSLVELAPAHLSLGKKAKKFALQVANGGVGVASKSDKSVRQIGPNTVLSFGKQVIGMFAPVVLDLDGDGVELVKRDKARAAFDMDGDGFANDTGWISGSDGFLVIDRDNDGRITDAAELSLAAGHPNARTGLQGLAALDSNGDGRVDSGDARFGELRVWQDRNGNGTTEAGELVSLSGAGIAAIKLAVTAAQGSYKIGSNALAATASFVRSDGSTGAAADVVLAYDPTSRGAVRSPASTLAGGARNPLLEALGWADTQPSKNGPRALLEKLVSAEPEAGDSDLGAQIELARKLALIRQDLGTFGLSGEGLNPLRREQLMQLDWFA